MNTMIELLKRLWLKLAPSPQRRDSLDYDKEVTVKKKTHIHIPEGIIKYGERLIYLVIIYLFHHFKW